MKILSFYRRFLLFLPGILVSLILTAQGIPSRSLSIPVYHPMVLNPAIVGSKDFTNISFASKAFKNPHHQILQAQTRHTSSKGYFTNLGLGGYTFLEQLDQSWNTGFAVTGAYHFDIDKEKVHHLAAGVSLKGIFGIPKSSGETTGDSLSTTFNPNMDLGVYYYGPTAFGGISVTSLFGTPESKEIPEDSEAYLTREYHLYGGYKFLLNRNLAIVLEPSLLVSLNDSSNITPYLKIYMQNFYIGTYIKSADIFALFFQYQFPRFYTGVFLEFPRKGYLNDDNIIFELLFGINLGLKDQKFREYRHW